MLCPAVPATYLASLPGCAITDVVHMFGNIHDKQ